MEFHAGGLFVLKLEDGPKIRRGCRQNTRYRKLWHQTLEFGNEKTFGETNNKNCKTSYVQENALAYIKENSLTLEGDFQSTLVQFTIREAWRLKIQSKSN